MKKFKCIIRLRGEVPKEWSDEKTHDILVRHFLSSGGQEILYGVGGGVGKCHVYQMIVKSGSRA